MLFVGGALFARTFRIGSARDTFSATNHVHRTPHPTMWRPTALLLPLVLSGAFARTSTHHSAIATAATDSLPGRWDITVHMPTGDAPSWLEVDPSGRDVLIGRFVGVSGSARPISRVEVHGDSLRFAIPPQWEEGNADLVVVGRLAGGQLTGSMTFPDGKRYDWSGVRAPALRRRGTPRWGAPIRLIRENDLGGWHPRSDSSHWSVSHGILRNARPGAELISDRTFGDFKLHVEFRYPKGSNSGVYLRGRHEVQIQDDYGKQPANDLFGGVYGFLTPTEIMARPAGEWNTFDITLVGRMVTIVANGRTVVCNREIPGITGGAIDNHEGEPGPLQLQGSEGAIEYRNLAVTPAR